jgi:uncharacterized phiE125 gp8 family phage protein
MSTNIVTVSVDGDQPVCVADAKAYARVDINDDDLLIEALITGAVQQIETFCRRDLIQRTYDWSLDCFPSGDSVLEFPRHPLGSVVSVQYYDTDDVLQTMPVADYEVDTGQIPGRIYLAPSATWPDTYDKRKAVTIQFQTEPGDLPANIIVAIEMYVAHWYENREAVVTGTQVNELPLAVENVLWANRLTVEI